MKQALFIDRDGTILVEPDDEQIDSFEKFQFVPGVIRNLNFIRTKLDFEFVMVSNQDGLGTSSYPEEDFWPTHNLMLNTLKGEGVTFDDILIDRSFPADNLPTRKPGTGMMTKYMTGEYDLANSYVIGDRETDKQLALNLGCKFLILGDNVQSWDEITEILFAGERTASVRRTTKETDIDICLNLDGTGKCDINTGLGFFDHMLEQIGKHGSIDLRIHVKGDLNVDEHHTIEDVAICLGEAFLQALGDKKGIERFASERFVPMDGSLAYVAIDVSGRPFCVFDAKFEREYCGDMPTEMVEHFFQSFAVASKISLNIKIEGRNTHHKIESCFKTFGKVLYDASRVVDNNISSTKGVL
jgi:imidazoleglycerol-phosphate dehydratase/histidinol-phosphatase